MAGPRIVQRIGKESFVNIVVQNPFPVPIKLFCNAWVGVVYETKVCKENVKEMNDNPETSPNKHPVDKLGKNVG